MANYLSRQYPIKKCLFNSFFPVCFISIQCSIILHLAKKTPKTLANSIISSNEKRLLDE